MTVMTFEQASDFLSYYPKTKAELEKSGFTLAEEMLSGISEPAVRERLRRGEITPAEDVEPQASISLGELDVQGLKLPRDYFKIRAAAFVYARGPT